MRSALSHANELALREGRDPTTLGFDLDANGEVALTAVPDFETIDLVKRGLQGVADRSRDAFGNMTNEGRTIVSMGAPLVRRAREVNPAYGAALDAYSGEISGRAALTAGRDSLRNGADDLINATADLTPFERQNFALGNRSAMATDAADFGRQSPTGNLGTRIQQSFGQPGTETYGAMQSIHGSGAMDRLASLGGLEDAAHRTWSTVRSSGGGSRGIDTEDGRLADAARGVIHAGLGNPLGAVGSLAKSLATGNHQQGEIDARIASVLAEPDLDVLQRAMRQVHRERARRTLVDQNAGQAAQQGARFLGSVLGTNLIAPVDDGHEY